MKIDPPFPGLSISEMAEHCCARKLRTQNTVNRQYSVSCGRQNIIAVLGGVSETPSQRSCSTLPSSQARLGRWERGCWHLLAVALGTGMVWRRVCTWRGSMKALQYYNMIDYITWLSARPFRGRPLVEQQTLTRTCSGNTVLERILRSRAASAGAAEPSPAPGGVKGGKGVNRCASGSSSPPVKGIGGRKGKSRSTLARGTGPGVNNYHHFPQK